MVTSSHHTDRVAVPLPAFAVQDADRFWTKEDVQYPPAAGDQLPYCQEPLPPEQAPQALACHK